MQSVLTSTTSGHSLWHRLDARLKLVGILINLVLLAFITTFSSAVLALGISLLFLLWSGVPLRTWLERFLSVAGFLLLFVIVLPWTVGPSDLPWGLSQRGLYLASMIFCKGLCAIAWVLFLTGTTTIEDLLHAATQLHLPRPILRVLIVTWHYVQVMYRTIDDFRVALRLRGFRNKPSWQTYQTMTSVIGTLFVYGYDRTERLVQAMHLRGYHGTTVSLDDQPMHWRDTVYLLMIVLGNGGLCWWSNFAA
jgi:cobalt/nickel transport system permease protein